jgi:RHS repeat-associated protein
MYFVYDLENVVAEYDGNGQLQRTYVTRWLDAHLSLTSGGSTYYYLKDALGSVRQVLDADQATQDSYDYQAFGSVYGSPTENLTQPFRFTGREWEGETQLYYYRFRDYAAATGRFVRRDPLFLDPPANRYAYVGGNPAAFIDPFGLDKVCFTPTADQGHGYVSCVNSKGEEYRKGWPQADKDNVEHGSWNNRVCCKCPDNKDCPTEYDECKKRLSEFGEKYAENFGAYNFKKNNCMDFVTNAAAYFGADLPSAKRWWLGTHWYSPPGRVSEPATFEDRIRQAFAGTSEDRPRRSGCLDCWLETAPGVAPPLVDVTPYEPRGYEPFL